MLFPELETCNWNHALYRQLKPFACMGHCALARAVVMQGTCGGMRGGMSGESAWDCAGNAQGDEREQWCGPVEVACNAAARRPRIPTLYLPFPHPAVLGRGAESNGALSGAEQGVHAKPMAAADVRRAEITNRYD